jgi:uncharacterized protein YkwD
VFVGRAIGGILAALLCAGAVVATATAAPVQQRTAGITRVTQLEGDVLAQLNSVRRANDLVPLKLSTTLSKVANEHSVQMGRDGYFAHESFDGAAFWKRIERVYPSHGWKYWAVGENLLWSSPDVDGPRALELWMASPEHKKNILTAKWREIGISAVHVAAAPGTYNGLDVTIVTTDFGVRK